MRSRDNAQHAFELRDQRPRAMPAARKGPPYIRCRTDTQSSCVTRGRAQCRRPVKGRPTSDVYRRSTQPEHPAGKAGEKARIRCAPLPGLRIRSRRLLRYLPRLRAAASVEQRCHAAQRRVEQCRDAGGGSAPRIRTAQNILVSPQHERHRSRALRARRDPGRALSHPRTARPRWHGRGLSGR